MFLKADDSKMSIILQPHAEGHSLRGVSPPNTAPYGQSSRRRKEHVFPSVRCRRLASQLTRRPAFLICILLHRILKYLKWQCTIYIQTLVLMNVQTYPHRDAKHAGKIWQCSSVLWNTTNIQTERARFGKHGGERRRKGL